MGKGKQVFKDLLDNGRQTDYRVAAGLTVILDLFESDEERLDFAACLENATIDEIQQLIELLKEPRSKKESEEGPA